MTILASPVAPGAAAATASQPDPAGGLRFTVDTPGLAIGRFSECSGLGVEYEVVEYREGGQNAFVHTLRGALKYRHLVLKRGVTGEDALLHWFQQTQDLQTRPTITVSLIGPDAQPIRRWGFERAFPVRWTGPVLNAGMVAIASEELEIAHRGLVPVGHP
jgi:phage tail-like protein